jgi:tripartite-type tricarboxylate transporter receptor subunit TctC
VREQGFPNMELFGWNGFFAPAKTPPAAVAVIQAEMAKKDASGRILYFDPGPAGQEHRQKIEKMRVEMFNSRQAAA